MNLDDEAERVAQLAGWEGEALHTRKDAYMPEHRAPQRPKPEKVADDVLRAAADRDIARMFAEDDGADFMMVDGHCDPVTGVLTDANRRLGALRLGVDPSRIVGGRYDDSGQFTHWFVSGDYEPNDYLKPGKAKPAGKTYVQPGRKMGKVWVDRLNQSKKAKR